VLTCGLLLASLGVTSFNGPLNTPLHGNHSVIRRPFSGLSFATPGFCQFSLRK
jgi:hypothetical protein